MSPARATVKSAETRMTGDNEVNAVYRRAPYSFAKVAMLMMTSVYLTQTLESVPLSRLPPAPKSQVLEMCIVCLSR